MAEIKFWFPSIFGRRVSLPYGDVQSSARGAFVENNVIHFILFLGINQVRRRLGEGGTMCFSLESIVDLPCGRKAESVH